MSIKSKHCTNEKLSFDKDIRHFLNFTNIVKMLIPLFKLKCHESTLRDLVLKCNLATSQSLSK